MITCPRCNSAVTPGASVCQKCGYPLGEVEAVSPSSQRVNRYKKHLWKFVVCGVVLTALSLPARLPQVSVSAALAEVIGGAIFGWLLWLLWARAYKVAAGVGMFLVMVIGLESFLEWNKTFDVPAAVRQCSARCQVQWNVEAANAASRALKLTNRAIGGLCDCSCETGFRNMTAEQVTRLTRMKSADAFNADEALKRVVDDALGACYPKFAG
jgi:hypothetical protein